MREFTSGYQCERCGRCFDRRTDCAEHESEFCMEDMKGEVSFGESTL